MATWRAGNGLAGIFRSCHCFCNCAELASLGIVQIVTQDAESPAYVVHHDGWGELVMNRPKRKNALTPDMMSSLREGLDELITEGSNAILLRGEGGTFCSGLDLDVYSAGVPDDAGEIALSLHIELFECPAIIVGALERYAINGGVAFALACDVLVAGETAQLRIGEVRTL